MIQRYRFPAPIKRPCLCPHMSRLQLLICSPRFSAWLINKCPSNFAQLVSHFSHRLKKEKKTYSILMHIRGNSDTSSGGIDHRHSPSPRRMPMTSIIRPHGCWPMCSRRAPLSSTPFRAATTNPLLHPATLLSPPFHPVSLFWCITYMSSPLPFPPAPPLPSPLVSLHFRSFFIPFCNQITVTPCWC